MSRIPLRARDGSVRAYAIVDEEDFERFGHLRWSLHSRGYAQHRDGRAIVLLHREIVGLVKGDPREVDHENRDRLDCRRENLRIVPKAGNRQNTMRTGGTSRFRGVSRWRGRRWQASVGVDGRRVWVGLFDDEIEAARAVEATRLELLPFAFPDPGLEALDGIAA